MSVISRRFLLLGALAAPIAAPAVAKALEADRALARGGLILADLQPMVGEAGGEMIMPVSRFLEVADEVHHDTGALINPERIPFPHGGHISINTEKRYVRVVANIEGASIRHENDRPSAEDA